MGNQNEDATVGLPEWKIRAAAKRRQQYESIPKTWRLSSIPSDSVSALDIIRTCGILTQDELTLTEITDGKILQQKLLSGKVTAVEVITAFSKRASIAQQLTGCCTEMFFDRALERARWLDEIFRKTGRPVGPLHGFPISFKDNFDVSGVDSTIGWVGLIGKPVEQNSMGVDLVLSLGAVVYVKTNIPQSLMMSDSYNHVFKQSLNALNRTFISGGSSGGEAALVAAHGSLLGVGTDIGGSIRIPAVLQGLYGLCPTIGRVANDSSARTQKYVVPPVAGPIASSLSSIELYMESLLDSEPWTRDPHLLPIPWRKDLAAPSERPLKLAFIFDDGVIKPQPPIERAARETAHRLQIAGHSVIEWDATAHREAYAMWLEAVLADGGEECRQLCLLANEPLVEGMLVGKPDNLLSVDQRRDLEERKTRYQREYLKRWVESGIDALIMPVLPWVAFAPKTWVRSKQWVGYTAHWNFVNYACLTVPVTTADASLDQPSDAWEQHHPRNESDDFNHRQFNIDDVRGMPVGLQIVGGRFGEEKAVAVAKVIQDLNSHKA